MIVCSCRVISDKQYKTKQELEKRLREPDIQCGSCIKKNKISKKTQ